jgi:hypothetical protein
MSQEDGGKEGDFDLEVESPDMAKVMSGSEDEIELIDD